MLCDSHLASAWLHLDRLEVNRAVGDFKVAEAACTELVDNERFVFKVRLFNIRHGLALTDRLKGKHAEAYEQYQKIVDELKDLMRDDLKFTPKQKRDLRNRLINSMEDPRDTFISSHDVCRVLVLPSINRMRTASRLRVPTIGGIAASAGGEGLSSGHRSRRQRVPGHEGEAVVQESDRTIRRRAGGPHRLDQATHAKVVSRLRKQLTLNLPKPVELCHAPRRHPARLQAVLRHRRSVHELAVRRGHRPGISARQPLKSCES